MTVVVYIGYRLSELKSDARVDVEIKKRPCEIVCLLRVRTKAV